MFFWVSALVSACVEVECSAHEGCGFDSVDAAGFVQLIRVLWFALGHRPANNVRALGGLRWGCYGFCVDFRRRAHEFVDRIADNF